MCGEAVSILDGTTFVVSDRRGDVDAAFADPQGLFHRDLRYLSRWRLTVDGAPPRILSIDDFAARFVLLPPDGGHYDDSAYSVVRSRTVADGFREDLTVVNHTAAQLELELRIEADADFADRSAVKDVRKGRCHCLTEPGRLVLGFVGGGFLRETWISTRGWQARIQENAVVFDVRVAPHGKWTASVDVALA